MAKKFVRGITDVKTITNQDFDTNNVNDLLSDGQYNYIHRKKGKSEEYHNLTANIKTISSDNTELLTVTNNNKTTNTATLHPKHDAQKEQVLESTRDTITIHHGANATAEKTTVDTNPEKVLEHENLISDSEYITLNHQSGDATTHIKTAALKEKLDNLQQTKQDTLVAGTGITIQGQTISATGGAHDSQKEQVIESTRNTITINHGTNGTAEKTTVDTNPQKVLEHENLISDSEYITLEHQTAENTTHIKTAALEQVLLQLFEAISSISTISIKVFSDTNFKAYKLRVETDQGALSTLSFDCYNAAETELTGELKQALKDYLMVHRTVSNGALTITFDGTTMKLINSSPSENVTQHATFTFPDFAY